MYWMEKDQPEGPKIPKWKRSVGISNEGELYLPAYWGAAEDLVVLDAGNDGANIAYYLNHHFVPASWLSNKYPHTKELCDFEQELIRKWKTQS